MQIFKEYPSLRNFLNPPSGGCFLQISLISDNPEILERSNFPFLEAAQSDPWHRLIKGKFITEAYSEIQEVFLLVPRDNYLLKKDELWPITNSSIDQSWQRALRKHWQDKSSIFLSNPGDEKNELISPWEPLFFCKKQKCFFPNLCPHCGKVLHLCREDDLLAEFNLPSYSQTLERYLYCPSCFKQGKIEFFTCSSNHAQPHVQDRFALMDGFSNLFSLELKEDIFPCKGCPYQAECFGVKNLARERITPFSFYPFYMLIFKARSLNAQDFIPLLGGAKERELQEELQLKQEWGRRESLQSFFQNKGQHAGHLFSNKESFFGEVLYLKLTFLHGVMQKLLDEKSFGPPPEICLSLDRIWVDLPAPGLLPTFWDFQVEIIDLPLTFNPSPFPNLPSAETFYFLGQLWFYALLTNKKQKISQVYAALRKAQEIMPKAESFSFGEFSPVFRPENIFWNPDGQKVPASFLPLWEESLQLGWSLLSLSLPEKSTFSSENLLPKLGKLREEIKDYLFQLKGPEPKAAPILEDAPISQILKKLLAEWTKAAQSPAAAAVETVILTPGQFKKEATPPTVAEEAPETVIISQEDYPQTKPSAAPELAEEAIQTVILRPEAKRLEKPSIPPAGPADEEVAQTVILGPQTPPPDDLGAETVIITSAAKTARAKKKTYADELAQEEISEIAPAGREDQGENKEDLLSETVIIQPKRTSEKGRYGGKK